MKTIKLWDGVNVITEDETTFCESPMDIWKLFGWDIDNDPNASECASVIMRELFCFGWMDISQMNNGNKLVLEVVPCKD